MNPTTLVLPQNMNWPTRSVCCLVLLPLLCTLFVLELVATYRSNFWSDADLRSSTSLQTRSSGNREPCNCSLSLNSNRDHGLSVQSNPKQELAEGLIAWRPPLRFCRIPRIHFGPRSNHSKSVTYQCEGDTYFQLGQRILAYGERGGSLPPNQPIPNLEWGRRKSIPLQANHSALFFGNSHTRQIMESFLCQYQEYIVDGALGQGNTDGVGFVRFANNATVQWLINSWVPFSNDVAKAVPRELIKPQPLDAFDVVVLGAFNNLPKKSSIGSSYDKMMTDASINNPDMNWTKSPPTLLDLAKTCPSKTTLVGVSMFKAKGGSTDYDGFLQQYKLLQKQGCSTVYLLKSRQHIETVGEGGSNKLSGGAQPWKGWMGVCRIAVPDRWVAWWI